MKKMLALIVSMIMTLSLLAGLFTVTALAGQAVTIEIEYGNSSASGYIMDTTTFPEDTPVQLDETEGKIVVMQSDEDSYFETFAMDIEFREGIDSDGEHFMLVEIDVTVPQTFYDSATPGVTYTGHQKWICGEESGDITVIITVPPESSSSSESSEESSEPEESSEESSEPEESSEIEESSEAEESSEIEESSEAEESSEPEESSKTSKPKNPGKPDTLTMGGGTAASGGDSKPAPDTGMSNAPLIALGIAAMAGLAILAFKKK